MIDHDTDAYYKIAGAFVDGQPSGNLTRDQILDNITLYWLTATGASAARSYWEAYGPDAPAAGNQPLPAPPIPFAFTAFPGEIWRTPRSWVEASYPNTIYFNEVEQGRPLRRLGGAGVVRIRAPSRIRFTPLTKRKEQVMSASNDPNLPTVVLVHGAFADASSWNGVIERLQANGVPVTAPANPLRGIAADSAYVASVLGQIEGPVLAVGHSYGGAVITNAAADARNVVGLVYVAAFAPEEGETLGVVEAGSKDSVLNSALVPRTYPTTDGGSATEFSIDPAKAREAFAGDLSDEQAALIAATQRPVSESAFSEPNGPAAWKQLPSWAVVATADKAAGTDVTRSMAERAGARITEVDGSHVIMISQPQAVANVILEAVAAVMAVPAGV